MFRTAVQSLPCAAAIGIHLEAELRRDDHLIADRRKRLPYQNFVREGAINLRGIEERDAHLYSLMHQGNHLVLVLNRSIREVHSHAAEAKCRYFEVAQLPLLHCLAPKLIFARAEARPCLFSKTLLPHDGFHASVPAAFPPNRERLERKSWGLHSREGKRPRSSQEPNCPGNRETS